MKKKKVTISHDIWEDLEQIKKALQEKNENQVHWSETIQVLIETYHNHLSQKKNSVSNVKNLQPAPPKEPINIPTSTPTNQKRQNIKTENHLNSTNLGLDIPPPPKKKPIKIEISAQDVKILAQKETKETKFILIECNYCGSKPILMPVPKSFVLNSEEPVVDVSYIHGDPEHVIVAQLDHDFQVRRRRVSKVVYEKDFK